MQIVRGLLWLLLASFSVVLAALAAEKPATSNKLPLHDHWELQSSCKTKATGAEISLPGFTADGWHKTQVPSTVVAALVADKTFSDPNYGMNLRSIPGVTYSIGDQFANLPMPQDSPFACSWWYRTEFTLPGSYDQKAAWLHFDGINYRANIWINGQKLADAKDIAGTFLQFEFEVARLVHAGKPNAIAVEVFAPQKNDLAITWVDWNPAPPDKNMGLWKDVYLTDSGPVALRHPFVSPKLDPDYKTAALTVSADLRNTSAAPVKAALVADIPGIGKVSQDVDLAASESKTVSFSPDSYSQLRVENPKLWWPYQMGEQNLYGVQFTVEVAGKVSDSSSLHFGIRQVTSELTDKGALLFKINGKRVLIRGGGWSSDMLLRWYPKKIESELRYTRDMGLNTIRLEGKLERDEFYDMADRMGILIMPGWCCCDMWEHWPLWQAEHYKIAGASLESELRRLRNHPSVFTWLYGSDNPPPPDVEQMYLDIFKKLQWPNPTVSSASETPTKVSGPSGVKMTGPYDYVPPMYWLADKEAGGAQSFNSETSPGPAVPPLESLKKFIPANHLWPIDEVWNFHAGGERFTTLNIYNNAQDQRYGKSTGLDDYLRKSQAMAYEGQRAMFEAYARNKYASTGVIQWMLNNAWPSLIWHLYDYYLVPAGGYYGTKKADEVVHVQYSYDDNSVAVINGRYEPLTGMKVSAKVYNLDATEKASKDATLDLPADSATKAFDLPKVDGLSITYFLKLGLHDAAGKLVSDNFYWLSTKPDLMYWLGRRDTVYTPQSDYADLTGLETLPKVKLAVHEKSGPGTVQVSLHNASKNLAFMVHLRITRGKGGDDVVPIFWEDNYVSLLPGEKRDIVGHYDTALLEGKDAVLEVDGWNVAASAASTPAPAKADKARP